MLCEICQKNEASVHFKQVCNGAVREMHFCEECTTKKGFGVQSPMVLTDFLFGVEVQQEQEPGGVDKVCPNCRMRHSDFQKTSRLGCAVCYETCSSELEILLDDMQKGSQHIGKVPATEKIAAEIASVQKGLDEAVASQNFEEAAKLRDLMRDLKGRADCVNSQS